MKEINVQELKAKKEAREICSVRCTRGLGIRCIKC